MTIMQSSPESFHGQAAQQLVESGFCATPLQDLHLAESLGRAPNGNRPHVPYALFGNPDAPNVFLQSAPYLTDLKSPHYLLRLAAQQRVLGDDYAVVGVQAYDGVEGKFTGDERDQLKKGDFSPLSERMFRVVDALKLSKYSDYQLVSPIGYSLGGDVALQTARDALLSKHRGVVNVKATGAYEFARGQNRGLQVVGDMNKSGKNLFKNVIGSDMTALSEAWGIGAESLDNAQKKFDRKVMVDAGKYMVRGALNNLRLVQGFGTDKSVEQIRELMFRTSTYVQTGRQENSLVFPKEVEAQLYLLSKSPRARGTLELVHERGNDHSADDNIRRSAGRVLYFASRVKAIAA